MELVFTGRRKTISFIPFIVFFLFDILNIYQECFLVPSFVFILFFPRSTHILLHGFISFRELVPNLRMFHVEFLNYSS